MSRKFREDKTSWRVPSVYAFSGDYSHFKPPRDGSPIENVLVLLASSSPPLSSSPEGKSRHPMCSFAAQAQSILLSSSSKEKTFHHILVIDVSTMIDESEGQDLSTAISKENESRDLVKGFGRSILKLIQRLSLRNVILAAEGELSGLLLKLHDAATEAKVATLANEIWLFHPLLPASFVNTILVPMGSKQISKNNDSKGERSLLPQLHIVFSDEKSRDKRLDMLRHVFPSGTEEVISSSGSTGGEDTATHLIVAMFGNQSKYGYNGINSKTQIFDPYLCDSMGRSLFLSAITVEMNRHSKQYERLSEDVTDDLLGEVCNMEDKENGEDYSTKDVDWEKCERHVAALVLRGNRCLLVRSLSGQWKGMRIPSVVPKSGESQVDSAIRAVVESTGVDATEVKGLPLIPSVPVYVPNGRSILMDLLPVYATAPPPDGPLEDQDMEDDETPYDWYTLENAEKRLDDRSIAALRSISFLLVEAANVGLLPCKWGGVFGQEMSVSLASNNPSTNSVGSYSGSRDQQPLQVLSKKMPLTAEVEEWKPSPDVGGGDVVLDDVRKANENILARLLSNKKDGKIDKLPVTLLSGFLGSGKTTLLKHILSNYDGMRVAILVNDMGEINIDAALVKHQTVSITQREEHLVEMSNGCICCTLREDLLTEVAKIASQGEFDYLLIESTGVSEPMPVAETFTFEDNQGLKLGDVAQLDCLVTVVDCSRFFRELESIESLRDRDWHADPEDKRTISHLLCDQVEFANVIVLNKCDLVNEEEKNHVKKLIRHMNPVAEVIESIFSTVPLDRLLGTGLFSMSAAEQHPSWLKEARVGEHRPETIEYGISSFTYRARKPFMPYKFHEVVEAMLRKEAPFDEIAILRAKGFVWLANFPGLQGDFSLAGNHYSLIPGNPWWAEIDKADWPEGLEEALGPLWCEPFGDRQQEIVIIGQDLDKEKISSVLDSCLLDDKVMDKGQDAWYKLCNEAEYDPFYQEWYDSIEAFTLNAENGHIHEHKEEHDHTYCQH